jgi:hypothetical protein
MTNRCSHRICRTTEPCRYGDASAPETQHPLPAQLPVRRAFTPGTTVSRDELAEAIAVITGAAGEHAYRSVGSLAAEHDGAIPAHIAEAELDGWIADMIAAELA